MTITVEIEKILLQSKTIAVVGASRHPRKAAHFVPKYLQKQGFTIIPVNPNVKEILGEQCFPTLSAIGHQVDIVDIFRPGEFAPAIVTEAIKLSPKLLWLQLGIKSEEAKAIAEKNGIPFVQDHCLKIEHSRLVHK